MFVFDLVDEVVLEGLDDEVFVVHEEDILGNGNGLVAVVNGGGGVEKFEALAVAFVFGGGFLMKAFCRRRLSGPVPMTSWALSRMREMVLKTC